MVTALSLFVSLAQAVAPSAPAVPPPVARPAVQAPVAVMDPLAERPVIGAATPWAAPVPQASKLSNGASLWVVPMPSLPLVTVVLSVPAGAALDTPLAQGVQWLSDRMLTQGAGKRDAAAFTDAVERLGASIDVDTSHASSSISLTVRKENLAPALDLVADMVLRPSFARGTVAQERELAINGLLVEREDPDSTATKLAWAAWFGEGHPYANPPSGTVEGLRRASRGAVKKRWKQAWHAGGATFTAAGDVTGEEMSKLLEARLGAAWKARDRARGEIPAAPAHTNAPVLLIDKPEAAQTMFALAFPGVAMGAPEAAPVRAGTIVLGGSFTSRLNALLREKRGYTYGARARSVSLPGAGMLFVSTRIRTDATGPAMKDLLGELESIRKGITPAELVKATATYRQDLVESMESRNGVAGSFAGWHVAGAAPDALARQLVAAQGVSLEFVAPAMSAYDPARAVFVLMGDRKVVEPALKEAGITAITVAQPL